MSANRPAKPRLRRDAPPPPRAIADRLAGSARPAGRAFCAPPGAREICAACSRPPACPNGGCRGCGERGDDWYVAAPCPLGRWELGPGS